MASSMNIKNREAVELAKRLAVREGTTMTGAIVLALRREGHTNITPRTGGRVL